MSNVPQVTRIRHELRRRRLEVARVDRSVPGMLRVVLVGEELRGFTSLAFDDHIKLFFPDPKSQGPAMRDFTPRRFDPKTGQLWVDFYLHEAGPATQWASQAEAGQSLTIGGPKGSALVSLDGIEHQVLIGDETAVPAISRRLEELPSGTQALVVLEGDVEYRQLALQTQARCEVIQVPRDSAAATQLLKRLRDLKFPAASYFWVALESQTARDIRRYLREERGIAKEWIKAAAYWKRGEAGANDKIVNED